MTDRNRLLKTLAGCYAYYERELSDVAVSVWLADLDQFTPDEIEAAFTRHRRDPQRGQWLPKSADILRQLQGDTAEKQTAAWAHVLGEARRVGMYGCANLTAEQRSAVDAVGGWAAICHCDERELGHMQRRFMACFDAFDARAVRDADRLTGPAAPAVANILRKALQCPTTTA